MLRVIWVMLVIAGVLLLALLAVLLCALFVAVTCKVRGEFEEGRLSLCVTAGWLFRALTLRFTLKKEQEAIEPQLILKVFGIPVKTLIGEEKKPKKEKRQKRKTKPQKDSGAEAGSETEEAAGAAEKTEKKEEAEAGRSQEKAPKREERPKRRGPLRMASEKLCALLRKLRAFADALRRIPEFFRNIRQKLQELRERKDFLLDFWNREEHVRARGAIRKEVFYLLRKLKPKKMEGRVHFGFDDPSRTGMVMGAASVFYPCCPGKLVLEPDFEESVLEGNIYIFGKLRLCVLAGILARLIFNRDVRLMYKNWKER